MMASSMTLWQAFIMVEWPDIHQKNCLNAPVQTSTASGSGCMRCHDVCPSDAITLDPNLIPQLDEMRCTACMACVAICPIDAISHGNVNPQLIVDKTSAAVLNGNTTLTAACAATDARADIHVGCHAEWDPLMLACLTAEGVRTLHLDGISQCDTCPVHYGARMMQQTERDYATLNQSLGVHLDISSQKKAPAVRKHASEPERRTFFRNLIPSITQGAIMAAAQIGQTANQGIQQDTHSEGTAPAARLPVRLQLFLRALPRLQVNFTPVPIMSSIPLGAIQADANCTACGQCVEKCPTGALSIREFGANKILEFRPDACIGCQRCISLCPERALEPLPGISLPALLTRRKRPLVMVPNQTKEESTVPCRNN